MPIDSALAGSMPLAAVLGGIAALAISAAVLVLRRDHLRTGAPLPTWLWAAAGSAGGALIYLTGFFLTRLFPDLAAAPVPLAGIPWALALGVSVGAAVALVAGARATWHPAGVGVIVSLAVASAGWAGHLVATRVPQAFAEPSLVSIGLLGLLAAQLLALVLVCVVAAYMLDALVRRRWTREASQAPHDPDHRPTVAIHVACYDEPADVVLRTLDSLRAQDYPRDRLHVLLVDDSTDPAAVETLRAACAERGFTFLHRESRAGFKAGALNAALRATPPEVELIAVVDADFVADPGFVRDNVGYFVDPRLAFLQTKLDYSNSDESFTAHHATLLERFFYTSMMRTRNEGNAILFAGTMGILRRAAIEDVGGWADGHVGEDVDLSCRVLMKGWTSLYVPRAYGRGLQTPEHESFRRQQARWAYGGARILSDHARGIVFGRMSTSQKIHHLYGPFFWLDGALGLVFSVAMVFFAMAFLSGGVGWIPVHDLLFVGLIPILVVMENALRAAFTMRRLLGIRMKEVLGMILMGWSGKLMNARSAAAALMGLPRPFHRTPKGDGQQLSRYDAILRALRVAPLETALCGLQVVLAASTLLKLALVGTGGLPLVLILAAVMMMAVWATYFGSAPLCVYLGHVSRRSPGSAPPTWTVAARRRVAQ